MLKNNEFIFFKRVLAYCVDMIILAIVGVPICYFLFEQIVSIGNWARLIGFMIFILYFGLMNSSLCKGQTLGKMLLDIKIVDAECNYLCIQKSLLRAVILSPVVILHGTHIYMGSLFFFIIPALWGILVLFNLLLFLFNAPSRQVFHDLVIKSYVVKVDAKKIENADIKKTKIIVFLLISVLIATCINFMRYKSLPEINYAKLNEDIDARFKNNLVGYSYSGVSYWGEISETNIVLIYNAKNIPQDNFSFNYLLQEISDNLSKQIINNSEHVKTFDKLTIKFVKEATIGIVTRTHFETVSNELTVDYINN